MSEGEKRKDLRFAISKEVESGRCLVGWLKEREREEENYDNIERKKERRRIRW